MNLRESDSEPILSDIFKSWSWLPIHRIREYSFAAACLILLCLFDIAKFIDCLVGDTSLRLIYIHYQTLCINGGDSNILLSTFKLALLASFWVTYSFESLTQERG